LYVQPGAKLPAAALREVESPALLKSSPIFLEMC